MFKSNLFKTPYPKLLGSSVDRFKLSMTIKGILTAIVPMILVLAPMFGWTVNQEDFTNLTNGIDGLIDAVQAAVVAVTAVVSTIMIIWGVLRKIFVGLKIMKPNA